MAYLYRLIVVIVLTLASFGASAACYRWVPLNGFNFPTGDFPSPEALCASSAGVTNPGIPRTLEAGTYAGSNVCAIWSNTGSSNWIFNTVDCVPPPSQCQSSAVRNAAASTQVVEPLTKDQAMGIARMAAGGNGAVCYQNCVIQRKRAACGGTGGTWMCELYSGDPTGDTCDGEGFGTFDGGTFSGATPSTGAGSNTVTIEPHPDPTPRGKCPGEVNGVTVYVDCQETVGTEKTTETVSTENNGTTTVTRDSETTCSGDTCTTTTNRTVTTSTPNGSGGTSSTSTVSTDTQVDSKDDFCKKNPNHQACKQTEDGRFGGTCSASFSCSGDAIQCATARAVNEINCTLKGTSSAESSLYESEKGKTGNQTTGLPGNASISLGSGSIDQTNLLGSPGCISDKTITVMGASITLPMSDICPHLETLGNVLLALSFLLSVRIIGRGN